MAASTAVIAACALAARLAREGGRVLLATTDPAAHIGSVLSVEVSSEVRPVPGYPGLFAVRIDQKESVEAYKAKILSQAAASGHTEEMLAVVREELESPCTEEMAVFEEFSGLVERDDFDSVILDTAPTGHTLRLLELPYDYARQVEMMVVSRYFMQQHYLKVAEETFRLPIFKVSMLPSEPAGTEALCRVGRELLEMKHIALSVPETAAGIGGGMMMGRKGGGCCG